MWSAVNEEDPDGQAQRSAIYAHSSSSLPSRGEPGSDRNVQATLLLVGQAALVSATPDHLLGYRDNAQWRDMSEYLVHFTTGKEAFASILVEGHLRPSGPYGWGRKVKEVQERHMSACLSEIPLDLVDRLTARHGRWGIGFRRTAVIRQGGARVWYVDEGTPVAATIFNRVGQLLREQEL